MIQGAPGGIDRARNSTLFARGMSPSLFPAPRSERYRLPASHKNEALCGAIQFHGSSGRPNLCRLADPENHHDKHLAKTDPVRANRDITGLKRGVVHALVCKVPALSRHLATLPGRIVLEPRYHVWHFHLHSRLVPAPSV